MSQTNGHTPQPTSYRRQVREAEARLRLKEIEREERLLESWGGFSGMGMGWGQPWPQAFGIPGPLGPDARISWGGIGGRIDARRDGADRPTFWNEQQLHEYRGLARSLADSNPLAQGALESLADYTVRTGFQYQAHPGKRFLRDPQAVELAEQVQQFVEELIGLNTVGETDDGLTWADREWEAVLASARDGEVFFRVFDQGDGTSVIRSVLPEQVLQPLGSPPDWMFGKQSAPGDIERTLKYAVSYGDPADWEEVPADEMAHLKLNVDSTIKRGLSDFFSTGQAFEEAWQLLRAMRLSGKAQAGIAWIEEHPGATQDSLAALAGKTRVLNPPNIIDPLSGRDVNYQSDQPGRRLLVGGGRKYQSAPLAANTSNHISIFGACLRALGARWRMPEYMISGDSSNANYASTLVSGSPFVTRTECRQAKYGRLFVRVLWIAIRNAARAGRFVVGGHTFAYEEISRFVDITPTPPAVAIADKAVEAQVDSQDIQNGVMSLQTRRSRRGLDDDTERRNLLEEPPTRVAGRVTDLNAQGDPATPGQQGGRQEGRGPFFPRLAGG